MCIGRAWVDVNWVICRNREHLTLMWSLGDVECDLGVGSPPSMDAAVLVGVTVLAEGVFVDVGSGALALSQGVEPGRVEAGEQRRGPVAAVEPDQHRRWS